MNSIASTIKTYTLDGKLFAFSIIFCTATDTIRWQASTLIGYENHDDLIRSAVFT